MATVVTALSMTKEVKLPTDTNNICSNEKSRKNKCHNSTSITTAKRFILKYNLYTIEVNRRRNCYNYKDLSILQDTIGTKCL